MADGYLETKREQYEQRKALWLKNHRKTGSTPGKTAGKTPTGNQNKSNITDNE